MAACGGGSSGGNSGGSGSGSGSSAIRSASIFGEKRPILCVTEKKHQRSNPHIGTGTPRIGLGRDLSIFQIGESHKRYGVHSNLGTNIHLHIILSRHNKMDESQSKINKCGRIRHS